MNYDNELNRLEKEINRLRDEGNEAEAEPLISRWYEILDQKNLDALYE